LTGAIASAAPDPAPLPSPQVTLRVDAPEDKSAWRLVVTNEGDVPVRLAADGRLLTLEIQPPEPPPVEATSKTGSKSAPARKGPPAPIVCRLPASLRPGGVVDDRALILGPGARYEEYVNPLLYCFDARAAAALAPGATVTAKLGFPPPAARGPKKAPGDPPFVVEPSTRDPAVAAAKELTAAPFVITRPLEEDADDRTSTADGDDAQAPKLELSAPRRIEAEDELTINLSLTIKNTGGRPTTVHFRRDNLIFDVEGPDGPARCGYPTNRRQVPRDLFWALKPGNAQQLDVWVGEMCSDVIFDRPGLYQLSPTLAFPNATPALAVQTWTDPIRTPRPTLLRVLRGRLPFYAEPPQALGATTASP